MHAQPARAHHCTEESPRDAAARQDERRHGGLDHSLLVRRGRHVNGCETGTGTGERVKAGFRNTARPNRAMTAQHPGPVLSALCRVTLVPRGFKVAEMTDEKRFSIGLRNNSEFPPLDSLVLFALVDFYSGWMKPEVCDGTKTAKHICSFSLTMNSFYLFSF